MKFASGRFVFAACLFALLRFGAGLSQARAQANVVTVETGKVQGGESDGIVSWKGIPFAAPPVGALRWRDPQPAKPWAGVRPATAFAADCTQAGNMAAGPKRSEDCLYLNVWRPAGAATKLPVMVWIYGGAFLVGGTANPLYNGSEFAKHGVILVSVNYRLGRLGFFAHPALTAEAGKMPTEVLINYGIMDQLAGLQWVQRNIASFGGDPKNVTLFGESAGGFSVQALMSSPLAAGLFQRAIVESGAGSTFADRLDPAKEFARAESVGVAFAKSIGIEGTGPDALAKLRALSLDDVHSGMEALLGAPRPEIDTYAGPVMDGKLSLSVPYEVFRKGGGNPVALMIGATNGDKGEAPQATADAIYAAFGTHAGQAKAAYDPDGTLPLAALRKRVGSDTMMVEPARAVAKNYSKRGLTTYEYRFSYVPVARRANIKTAGHASELQFVFDHIGGPQRPADPADQAMAKTMIGYWASFARTGDPNGEGRPVWPKYTASGDMLMDFTNEGAKAGPDPWKGRLDAVEAVVPHGKP